MCTAVRFDDGQNNMYFGRNLDWSEDYGEKIVFAPHDYHYTPAFNAEDKNHPVIGIGIIVEDTPLYFDCMNDAGLAVAGLNFAKYCKYATEACKRKQEMVEVTPGHFIRCNRATPEKQ